MLYKCYVLPVFDYCSSSWAGISTSLTNRLEVTHRRLIRTVFVFFLLSTQPTRQKAVFAIPRVTSSHTVYAIASSCPLSNRLRLSSCKLIHKIRPRLAPPHVLSQLNWFHQCSATRNSLSLCFPISRTATLLNSPLFWHNRYAHWSLLSQDLKTCQRLSTFATLLAIRALAANDHFQRTTG